jgi:hypothetical protein
MGEPLEIKRNTLEEGVGWVLWNYISHWVFKEEGSEWDK